MITSALQRPRNKEETRKTLQYGEETHKPYHRNETLHSIQTGVNHLAGHGGVIGADDNEIGRDVDTLRLNVHTCRHMLHHSDLDN